MAEQFEQRLWADLVRDHGTKLATMPQRATTKRNAQPWLLVGAALGIAGTVTALALALTATTPAAYAVTSNPNGTVTVTIRELVGITGANAELARLGVRARVIPLTPGCLGSAASVPNSNRTKKVLREPPSHASGPVIPDGFSAVTLRPNEVPTGDTLVIAAREVDSHVQVTIRMVQDPAPTCSS